MNNELQIIPCNQNLVQQRQELLQLTLRPDDLKRSYSIEKEYPIVLGAEAFPHSFCVVKNQTLIAHANFWPRALQGEDPHFEHKVALIGNVATHPAYQGQGVMRTLMQYLWEKALTEKFEACFLWSDLTNFYKKLGFQPFGKELRFTFSKAELQKLQGTAYPLLKSFSYLPVEKLQNYLTLRPVTVKNIKRTPQEFTTLLQIPEMVLLSDESNPQAGYALLGKGCDMTGVVHEWGTKDPLFLLSCLQFIIEKTNWPYVILLAPGALNSMWINLFSQYGTLEEHPTSLAKIAPGSSLGSLYEKFFIWGLDSI